MSKDIVVIGGGAAGLMAAITAARAGRGGDAAGAQRTAGQKVNITGKGRCNVTNDCDRDTLLGNIPGNGRFLYSALTRFTPRDTMAFFEGLGVPLKVERGSRVFPVSDSAFDITNALERELKRLRVRWVRDRAVDIVTADGAVRAVTGEKGTYPAEAVIVATGGVSYPGTGSTGDGYRLAAAVGHTIVSPRGSLVPLESEDGDCAAMQGLSLRNVELTVLNGKGQAGVPGVRRDAVHPFRRVRAAGAVRQRPPAAVGQGAVPAVHRPEAGAGRAEAGGPAAAGHRRESQPGYEQHHGGAGAPQHGGCGAAAAGHPGGGEGQQPDEGTAPEPWCSF